MLVSIYIMLSILAVLLLVLGIRDGSMTFLGISALFSMILGFESFTLTVITSSGEVVKLAGTNWVLSFVWASLALIAIIHMMFDLSMWNEWRWSRHG